MKSWDEARIRTTANVWNIMRSRELIWRYAKVPNLVLSFPEMTRGSRPTCNRRCRTKRGQCPPKDDHSLMDVLIAITYSGQTPPTAYGRTMKRLFIGKGAPNKHQGMPLLLRNRSSHFVFNCCRLISIVSIWRGAIASVPHSRYSRYESSRCRFDLYFTLHQFTQLYN